MPEELEDLVCASFRRWRGVDKFVIVCHASGFAVACGNELYSIEGRVDRRCIFGPLNAAADRQFRVVSS